MGEFADGFVCRKIRLLFVSLCVPKSFVFEPSMDVDAYEDRLFDFEAKMKDLDNADDDYRAAERKGM